MICLQLINYIYSSSIESTKVKQNPNHGYATVVVRLANIDNHRKAKRACKARHLKQWEKLLFTDENTNYEI